MNNSEENRPRGIRPGNNLRSVAILSTAFLIGAMTPQNAARQTLEHLAEAGAEFVSGLTQPPSMEEVFREAYGGLCYLNNDDGVIMVNGQPYDPDQEEVAAVCRDEYRGYVDRNITDPILRRVLRDRTGETDCP